MTPRILLNVALSVVIVYGFHDLGYLTWAWGKLQGLENGTPPILLIVWGVLAMATLITLIAFIAAVRPVGEASLVLMGCWTDEAGLARGRFARFFAQLSPLPKRGADPLAYLNDLDEELSVPLHLAEGGLYLGPAGGFAGTVFGMITSFYATSASDPVKEQMLQGLGQALWTTGIGLLAASIPAFLIVWAIRGLRLAVHRRVGRLLPGSPVESPEPELWQIYGGGVG
jgi:hypothetical protein